MHPGDLPTGDASEMYLLSSHHIHSGQKDSERFFPRQQSKFQHHVLQLSLKA